MTTRYWCRYVDHDVWNSIPVPHPWGTLRKGMCRPTADPTSLERSNEFRAQDWLDTRFFHLLASMMSEVLED